MECNKKKLYIIAGVTGAIGTAVLAKVTRNKNNVVYGVSRKATSYTQLLKDGFLPPKTLICSIGDISSKKDCNDFIGKIKPDFFSEIIFVHSAGVYPFEVDAKGGIVIENDHDNDGIDDRVKKITYDAFFNLLQALSKLSLSVTTGMFSSISDRYKPAAHTSWWTVMGWVRHRLKIETIKKEKLNSIILNISSVMCPHEILTRPYVFLETNANPVFWLTPEEVAIRFIDMIDAGVSGYTEEDLFHKADYYHQDYFIGNNFTERKQKEIGLFKSLA